MDIHALKLELLGQLLKVKDENTLRKVKSLLDENGIVGYTLDGEALDEEKLRKTLEESQASYDAGKWVSHEEVKRRYLK